MVARPEAGLEVTSIVDLETSAEVLASNWHLLLLGETSTKWALRQRSESGAAVSLTLGDLRIDRWLRLDGRTIATRSTVHNMGRSVITGEFIEVCLLALSEKARRRPSDGTSWQGEINPGRPVSWDLAVEMERPTVD